MKLHLTLAILWLGTCEICRAQGSADQWKYNPYSNPSGIRYADMGQYDKPAPRPYTPSYSNIGRSAPSEYKPYYSSPPKDREPLTIKKDTQKPVPVSGEGTYVYYNGTYTGSFENSKRNGHGVLTGTGEYIKKYTGDWKDDEMNGYGTLEYVSGDKYAGNFVDGHRTGQGTWFDRNGEVFQGTWEDDKRVGEGTCTYPNGEKFVGLWRDIYKHGPGKLYDANGKIIQQGSWYWNDFLTPLPEHDAADGAKYYGAVNENIKTGHGIYIWNNGDKYEGDFKNDKREGQGTFKFDFTGTYSGEWKDDLMDGQGNLKYDNGTYTGGFKAGEMDGQGTMKYTDGSTYTGEWKNGQKNGQGIFTTVKGDRWAGTFRDGKIEGRATYTGLDGTTYTGDCKNGAPDGKGAATYPNGSKYEGDWKNNVAEGQGTWTNAAGDKFTGNFSNNKKNGKGVVMYKDGKKCEGTWKDDMQDGPGTLYDVNGSILQQGNWVRDKFIAINNKLGNEIKRVMEAGIRNFADIKGPLVFDYKGSYVYECKVNISPGSVAGEIESYRVNKYKDYMDFEEFVKFKNAEERDLFRAELNAALPGESQTGQWGITWSSYPDVYLSVSEVYGNKLLIKAAKYKNKRNPG